MPVPAAPLGLPGLALVTALMPPITARDAMTKISTTHPHTPAAPTERRAVLARKARKPQASAKATANLVRRGTLAEKRKDAAQAPRETKLAGLITLMREKHGASIDQLVKATGWQKHSVRGAISGTIKKRLGLKVISEKSDDGRTYRIAG